MKTTFIVGLLVSVFSNVMLFAQETKTPQTIKTMYVERNEFHLKFGASKDALPMWKEYLQWVQNRDKKVHVRLLTDVSGPAYTIILEILFETFEEAEPSQCRLTHQEDWNEFYQKFIPLCERSERTYYKLQVEF
jgi:hypothetical protein